MHVPLLYAGAVCLPWYQIVTGCSMASAVCDAQGGGYSVQGGCIQIYRAFERYLGSGELLAGAPPYWVRAYDGARRYPLPPCPVATLPPIPFPCIKCAAVKLDVPYIKMQRKSDSVLVRWAYLAVTPWCAAG